MSLFDDTIKHLHVYIQKLETEGAVRRMDMEAAPDWPAAGNRDIVLSGNTGLELGGPCADSFSLVLWTRDRTRVEDGRITRIGADLPEHAGRNQTALPYARIAILACEDGDAAHTYERCMELSLAAYDVSLKGYMMRAGPREMKEWTRISKEALEDGLSLHVAGKALLSAYKQKDYVTAAEIVTAAAGPSEIHRLKEICADAVQYVHAMRKMSEEMRFDCSSCEYRDVCEQVSELKTMAARLEKRKPAAGACHG